VEVIFLVYKTTTIINQTEKIGQGTTRQIFHKERNTFSKSNPVVRQREQYIAKWTMDSSLAHSIDGLGTTMDEIPSNAASNVSPSYISLPKNEQMTVFT
jgi:hypothetical protein